MRVVLGLMTSCIALATPCADGQEAYPSHPIALVVLVGGAHTQDVFVGSRIDNTEPLPSPRARVVVPRGAAENDVCAPSVVHCASNRR